MFTACNAAMCGLTSSRQGPTITGRILMPRGVERRIETQRVGQFALHFGQHLPERRQVAIKRQLPSEKLVGSHGERVNVGQRRLLTLGDLLRTEVRGGSALGAGDDG
jgi:hypothetical protein